MDNKKSDLFEKGPTNIPDEINYVSSSKGFDPYPEIFRSQALIPRGSQEPKYRGLRGISRVEESNVYLWIQ